MALRKKNGRIVGVRGSKYATPTVLLPTPRFLRNMAADLRRTGDMAADSVCGGHVYRVADALELRADLIDAEPGL